MELLRHGQLRELIEQVTPPCISIYLPTHRGGAEVRQGQIRLKNLLKKAEDQLASNGRRQGEVKALLEPIQTLCENSGFWQYQSDGLAIFRSAEKFLYYRLPLHVDELLVITDRFHVKPLLRLFTEDGRFYLLALSKKEVRFFQCTRFGVREISLPEGTPRSLAEVVALKGIEKQTQVHTAGSAALFHGHGARNDEEKQDLREFFRLVDRGVHEILRDERAPLVLAGVEYMLAIYREANTYPHLIDSGVTGTPEGRRPEELQSKAWAIVEPHFRRAREEAARRFEDAVGAGKASTDIKIVAPAAHQGRVDQLFVAVGKQIWGVWNGTEHKVEVHEKRQPGDRDLLNFAAIQTLLQGGAVYAVAESEVPGGGLLAAVFRF